MPPKGKDSAANETKSNRTHFLPPQRTKAESKDPQATEVDKAASRGLTGGRPDKAAYDREQEAIKAEIDALQAKLNDVRGQISGAKGGGGGALGERRKELRAELDALREDHSKNKNSRGKLLDQIKATQDAMQRKITELNNARSKLPFKSADELDVKIRTLESAVDSGSMRIVEEKRALAEIQTLKKQRKHVEAFGPQQVAIEADRAKVDDLRKQLDDPESKKANERWGEIRAELDKIGAEIAEQGKERDKLFDQRNELQKSLDEAYGRKRDCTAKYKDANDGYYAKLQQERQRRIERQRAERDAFESSKREEANGRLREEASTPAYEREIEDCRTLIRYFEKLVGSTSSELPAEPTFANGSEIAGVLALEKRTVDEAAFVGMTVVKKKGQEEEDFFVGGGGKKGKKGKKAPTAKEEASTTVALQLPLTTLSALLALAVPTPMTRDEVPATITALTEKRKWYMENQDRVTKERIADAEKQIAAAEARAKSPTATNGVLAEPKSPTEAVEEVRDKLGESALPQDEEAVQVMEVVDEDGDGKELVPPVEEA